MKLGSKVVMNGSMVEIIKLSANGKNNINLIDETISNLNPSLSAFTVYLGLNAETKLEEKHNRNVWIIQDYDLDKMYERMCEGDMVHQNNYVVGYFRDIKYGKLNNNASLFINAPFMDKEYWERSSNDLAEDLIDKASKVLKNFRNNISLRIVSSPLDILKYTSNYKGAIYGWDSSCKCFNNYKIIRKLLSVEGLYISSHWALRGFGVPSVMNLGKLTAEAIIRDN